MNGLKVVNKSVKTNYKLSQIYYLPSYNPLNLAYKFLIISLIRHYHQGNQFEKLVVLKSF